MAVEFDTTKNESGEDLIELYGSDGFYTLDSKTRELNLLNGADGMCYIGAKNDANVQHIVIKLDRIYNGIYLDTGTFFGIHYKSIADGKIYEIDLTNAEYDSKYNKSVYYDSSFIYINWCVGKEVTIEEGYLDFSLCINRQIDADGQSTIKWEFHSSITTAVIVNTLHGSADLPTIEYTPPQVDTWAGDYDSLSYDVSLLTIPINIITIDKQTRSLNISNTYAGAKGDHNITQYWIELPNYIDMSNFPIDWDLYLKYKNVNNNIGYSTLIHKSIENKHYGVWFVPIGATIEAGFVEISVNFLKKRNDDLIEHTFNSDIGTLSIVDTLENLQDVPEIKYTTPIIDGWRGSYETNAQLKSYLNSKSPTITIDTLTRQLHISQSCAGAKNDHHVTQYWITLPAIVKNNDPENWSLLLKYKNADNKTGFSNLILNEEKTHGVWFVPIGATIESGNISIALNLIKFAVNSSGMQVIEHAFNSDIGSLYITDNLHDLENIDAVYFSGLNIRNGSAINSLEQISGCSALGKNSIALGENTIAAFDNQLAAGYYNTTVESIIVIGNGTQENRSNALVLYKDGRMSLGANPIDEMDVVTKKYLEKFVSDLDIDVEEELNQYFNSHIIIWDGGTPQTLKN